MLKQVGWKPQRHLACMHSMLHLLRPACSPSVPTPHFFFFFLFCAATGQNLYLQVSESFLYVS